LITSAKAPNDMDMIAPKEATGALVNMAANVKFGKVNRATVANFSDMAKIFVFIALSI